MTPLPAPQEKTGEAMADLRSHGVFIIIGDYV